MKPIKDMSQGELGAFVQTHLRKMKLIWMKYAGGLPQREN